jgi:hypothetical protein
VEVRVSTGAHQPPPRAQRPLRWVVWAVAALAAAAGIGLGVAVGIDRAFFASEQWSWPPEPCVVEGVDARCGTFVVPENRAKPNGREIGLHVVVLPAFSKPPRDDAVTYLCCVEVKSEIEFDGEMWFEF